MKITVAMVITFNIKYLIYKPYKSNFVLQMRNLSQRQISHDLVTSPKSQSQEVTEVEPDTSKDSLSP